MISSQINKIQISGHKNSVSECLQPPSGLSYVSYTEIPYTSDIQSVRCGPFGVSNQISFISKIYIAIHTAKNL